ncbi:hypothetical protein G6L37_02230 [Agrobacterium rubi]|nr:hypothetical protein [Agrobacterium rubi]NTF24212.1 hypothetical protein [Agrobacterium rubi]
MNKNSRLRDPNLRTRLTPHEMWREYVRVDLLERLETSTGGIIRSDSYAYDQRRAA